jgi:hypothetical protein
VHHVVDQQQQAATQPAARMGAGEILGGKPARFQQRHRQSVAHGQRRGGAGSWRQPQGTGFLRDADLDMHIGGLGQVEPGLPVRAIRVRPSV